MAGGLLFENATVVTLNDAGDILTGGSVAIEGARIAGIYPAGQAPAAGPEVRRIDARGRVLMPGLVNAHTHLFQVLIRGVYERLGFLEWLRNIYNTGRVLDPDDSLTGALVGLTEAVQSGVTTLVDHHFLNRTPELAEAVIEGFQRVGVRGGLARTIMDIGGLAPAEVVETPAAGLRACEDLLARHHAAIEAGALRVWTGPNTPPLNTTAALLRETHAFARAHGIGVSTHVAESTSVVDAVRAQHGVEGVIAWFHELGALGGGPMIAAHSVHLSPREIQLMAEAGASISHNPVSNGFLGDGIAPVAEMLEAGVTVALGTDGAASNNSQDMFQVLKVAALFQRARRQDGAVLPPDTVLRLATRHGARALGLENEIGSVEVGKRADLIVVDLGGVHSAPAHDVLSHLVFVAGPRDVRTVVVDGRIVMDEGVMQTVDVEALRERALTRGLDLVRRIAAA